MCSDDDEDNNESDGHQDSYSDSDFDQNDPYYRTRDLLYRYDDSDQSDDEDYKPPG